MMVGVVGIVEPQHFLFLFHYAIPAQILYNNLFITDFDGMIGGD